MSLKEFDIELSKLRQGPNQYKYRLGTAFFESFANHSIRQADIELNLELDKSEFLVNLRFNISGSLGLDCEKCLSTYNQQLQLSDSLLVKITDEEQPGDEEDEIIYLSRNENSFNIGQHLYDTLILALPLVKSCADPGNFAECDKEMLSRLEQLSQGGTDEEEGGDERWDKLKDLFNNN